MGVDGLEAAMQAIGKSHGVVELELFEHIPTVAVVEGDRPDDWFVVFNRPYRETKYLGPFNEWEATKILRQWKSKYESLARQTDREITWVKGE